MCTCNAQSYGTGGSQPFIKSFLTRLADQRGVSQPVLLRHIELQGLLLRSPEHLASRTPILRSSVHPTQMFDIQFQNDPRTHHFLVRDMSSHRSVPTPSGNHLSVNSTTGIASGSVSRRLSTSSAQGDPDPVPIKPRITKSRNGTIQQHLQPTRTKLTMDKVVLPARRSV